MVGEEGASKQASPPACTGSLAARKGSAWGRFPCLPASAVSG